MSDEMTESGNYTDVMMQKMATVVRNETRAMRQQQKEQSDGIKNLTLIVAGGVDKEGKIVSGLKHDVDKNTERVEAAEKKDKSRIKWLGSVIVVCIGSTLTMLGGLVVAAFKFGIMGGE